MKAEINLRLSLKTKWFEMTKAGIKTEDYRDINEYWVKRLAKFYTIYKGATTFVSKDFDINTMTLGYPKNNDTQRILKLEHKGIEIREGNPEWGAEPGKLYFVILHGAIIGNTFT